MSEFETGTHTTKSDRVLVYVVFIACVAGTALLYKYQVPGFSRLALYLTFLAFVAAVYMQRAGHYSKKWRRRFAGEQMHVSPTSKSVVAPQREARFVHQGKASGIFDEGPEQLAHYNHWS